MPKRIQRRRTKGWRMPPGAVYVGRPTKWGNPFTGHPRAVLVEMYRRFVHPDEDKVCEELQGKDLACWCPLDQPCHADVLLDMANPD